MDKNKVKKEYNKKIQNLVKLNKHYYELSKPLVNDYEYDQIKADILSLEKKYDFLESANSDIFIRSLAPASHSSIDQVVDNGYLLGEKRNPASLLRLAIDLQA